MNIGFDAKRAIQNNTGLGNYSRYVIDILSRFYPENDYVLFCPKQVQKSVLPTSIQDRKNVFLLYPACLFKFFSALWRLCFCKEDIKKQKINVFHGLSNELPLGIRRTGVPAVITIHDLIFMRFARYYSLFDRWIYGYKVRKSCRAAKMIIAVSECTKQDIITFLGVPADKITVVYQGCSPDFCKRITENDRRNIAAKYHLPEIFLLNVGTIEPRKNGLLIAKALLHLPEHIHWVTVGKKTKYQNEIESFAMSHQISHRIHIFNDIPFEDLPGLYQTASIFVYPSFFEGFGIPVIEALNSEIPVIAATGSCLEEVGGHDSVYLPPDNEYLWAQQVQKILKNSETRTKMVAAGKKYVARFNEQYIAETLMKIYSSLC
ncbi:MAG: glycosyltransferase family 4 protein [Bacteroidales bacterium]|jgi:glycosyltransferase involved in cell wall biosynthesis|nr:glycosyltransferase family 4 protein [Bacteroidales bacterium]